MFKIGKVKLENQLILAPIAAVNCSAFRLICKEYGAGLVTTQMFHCNLISSVFNEDKPKFERLLGIQEKESPQDQSRRRLHRLLRRRKHGRALLRSALDAGVRRADFGRHRLHKGTCAEFMDRGHLR